MDTKDAARLLRRVQTPAKRRLWAALRDHHLAGLQFRRQHPVGSFIADFYCHAAKLVVEVDGPIHTTPAHAAADRDRDELFASLGLHVLRVANDEVFRDLPGVIQQIRAAAQSSRPTP